MQKKMIDTLWVEKYRPKTIQETILPANLKTIFQSIVDSQDIPNMLLCGTPGLGKTTVARALCNETDSDFILINGSEESNIDTLRGKIKQFASTVSFHGGKKVVILDEADYLNPNSFQPALRGFIEEFSNNCRFIMTCNFKNRIIEPLHSRMGVYDFNMSKKDMPDLAGQFFVRLKEILSNEGVTYDESMLPDLIMKHVPDWRRILNECQRYSSGGVLQVDVLSSKDGNYTDLFDLFKSKDFKSMRSWVSNNMTTDTASIFRSIYDHANDRVASQSIPQLVLILADYQYKNAFVADHELNTVACFTEIMRDVEIK
jgi:DNA polymerase III delta prime subunit